MVKVLWMVINHNIGPDNTFVTAKDYLPECNKLVMVLNPEYLISQAIRKFCSEGNNNDIILVIKIFKTFHTA